MKLTVFLDGEKETKVGEITRKTWKSAGIRAGWYKNDGTVTQAEYVHIPEIQPPKDLPEGEYTLILRDGK